MLKDKVTPADFAPKSEPMTDPREFARTPSRKNRGRPGSGASCGLEIENLNIEGEQAVHELNRAWWFLTNTRNDLRDLRGKRDPRWKEIPLEKWKRFYWRPFTTGDCETDIEQRKLLLKGFRDELERVQALWDKAAAEYDEEFQLQNGNLRPVQRLPIPRA